MDSEILLDQEANADPGDPIKCNETYANTVIFEVSGTFTGLDLHALGRFRDGGSDHRLSITDVSDRAQSTAIDSVGIYLIDGTGLFEVLPDVNAIGSGSVTVRARIRVG